MKIESKKFKGKFIYGDFLENERATKLAIFMSGFSGSKNLPLFKTTSDQFFKKDFSVVRFNFCNDDGDSDPKIDAPEIKDMSFSVYIAELKNIIDKLGGGYSRITLIGHSFGAVISILFLAKYKKYTNNIDLVLWDPTLLPWDKKGAEEDLKNGEIEVNTTFLQELTSIDSVNIFGLLNKNICIIAAENTTDEDAENYFLKTPNKNLSELHIIKEANHFFDGEEVQRQLIAKTLGFLIKLPS
jgi:alpha/beta superfamily hydrolase